MEAIIAIGGILGIWLFGVIATAFVDESGFLGAVLVVLCGVGIIYFIVRIIHWAWVTPMPFFS